MNKAKKAALGKRRRTRKRLKEKRRTQADKQ